MGPGGAGRSQDVPGGARRSLEEPEGARRGQEEPGGAKRGQEGPGGARRSQGDLGGAREGPGRARKTRRSQEDCSWLFLAPGGSGLLGSSQVPPTRAFKRSLLAIPGP